VSDRSEYLTIGQIARLSGLTTKALRHYHAVGVLAPAVVDDESGYRLYARDQVEVARDIRVLRELHVPLGDIRVIIENRGGCAGSRLVAHRRRLGAQLTELQTTYYFLGKLIEEKEMTSAMPSRPTMIALEPELQRKLAGELFNYVWTLLEKEDRTERETELMVAAAYASRFFWEEPGDAVRHVRGEWQISRACAVAEMAEAALRHGHRCLALCEEHGIADFDLAYAYEALARAHAVAGDDQSAKQYADQARAAAELISDQEDRELVDSDLATLSA
jgi:DNA-binding transcriptional MerR regulator